jgi:hypothetical protein
MLLAATPVASFVVVSLPSLVLDGWILLLVFLQRYY